jgi:hypothetical protein
MNNKKISLIASLIFLCELIIFIVANHRNFELSIVPLWLVLNLCIIIIAVLSFLKRLSKDLLVTLAAINFLPGLIVLIGIGFSTISFLIIFWAAAIILNIYLLIIGIKIKKVNP